MPKFQLSSFKKTSNTNTYFLFGLVLHTFPNLSIDIMTILFVALDVTSRTDHIDSKLTKLPTPPDALVIIVFKPATNFR